MQVLPTVGSAESETQQSSADPLEMQLREALEDLRVTRDRLVQAQGIAFPGQLTADVELTDELIDVFRQAIFP